MIADDGAEDRPTQPPRIGVTGKDAAQLRNYVDAIAAAGGDPVPIIPGDARPADAILDGLEGLVLTGGKDIDPELYGQRLRSGLDVDVDEARDALEIPLARRALERDLPALGICRGIQVLNVAAGGTLHQDVTLAGAPRGSHNQRAQRPEPPESAAVHEVTIAAGSELERIVGARRLGVNTFHHQVIDRVAPRFAVTARSIEPGGEGLVEAVEGSGRSFAVGVQWHPERMWRRVPACASLFAALVRAAARKPVG